MKLAQDTRLLPGIVTALIGGFLVWRGTAMPHSRGWASSPGLFPIIIGAVLVLLALLLLIERHRLICREKATPRDPAAPPMAPPPFLRGDVLVVLTITAGLAAYILALNHLPYEPVTFVFLVIAMWGFGTRSILQILVAATAFTLVIVILFTQVLGTLIPGTSNLIETLLY